MKQSLCYYGSFGPVEEFISSTGFVTGYVFVVIKEIASFLVRYLSAIDDAVFNLSTDFLMQIQRYNCFFVKFFEQHK